MIDVSSDQVPNKIRELIESLVEETVDRRLLELLGDPDEGLELREEIVEQLKTQQARVAAGDRGRSIEEVRKELGLL